MSKADPDAEDRAIWRDILTRIPYAKFGEPDLDPPCKACGQGKVRFLISERTERCDRLLDAAGFPEGARANAMWNFFGHICNDCIVQICLFARRVESKAGRTWEDRRWMEWRGQEMPVTRFRLRPDHLAEWLITRAKNEIRAVKKSAA